VSTSVRSETSPPAFPSTLAVARPSLRSSILIALAALLLMAPELMIGMTVTDNYRFNLLWPEQFGELLRGGNPYPRWLPHAWKGLGTPAFYFYPPIFFWVTGAVDALSAGALPSERFVPIGTLIVLAASGLAMRAWLSVHASEKRALIGAIAYMAAPYHLYDIYCRGALAEATAYASVPVIILALARLGQGRARYLPLLSVGYATLLLTHLPTALLVSLLLIPAYVGWIALNMERPLRFLTRALAGGLIGMALAAIYLVPALSLLPFVNPASLTRAFYRPETWFFWNFPSGTHGVRMMLFIIPLSVGAAFLAAGTLMSPQSRQGKRGPLLWAAVTILVVVLVAGLIPPFWKLPGLALVQFPSRALLIVEFATITLLATTTWSLRNPAMLAGAIPVAFAYVAFGLMARHTIGRTATEQALTASQIRSAYLDAPEYLPAGVKVTEGVGPDDVEVELAKVPLAQASDPRARIAVSEAEDGGMTVRVDSPATTQIAVRRYYFPHWRVHDGGGRVIPVAPEPEERVVTFKAPAGKSVARLELGRAPNELLGRIVSLIGLVLLAIAAVVTRRERIAR
jgi:hypothetical protein